MFEVPTISEETILAVHDLDIDVGEEQKQKAIDALMHDNPVLFEYYLHTAHAISRTRPELDPLIIASAFMLGHVITTRAICRQLDADALREQLG